MLSYKGIAEGVENTNYLLRTTRGSYILTLYEKRVREDDLPFFLGLMQHLPAGLELPVASNRSGEALGRLAGRPAVIFTFLDGVAVRRPDGAALRGARATPCGTSHGRATSRGRVQCALAGGVAALFELAEVTPTRWRSGSRSGRAGTRSSRRLAGGSPERDHPRGPLHRQRVLHRRARCRA